MTLAERIVELLKHRPGLSDRKITDELFGIVKSQQPVNIACRGLEKKGIISRQKIGGNPIGNYLTGQELITSSRQSYKSADESDEHFSEDAIKEALENWLIVLGWQVKIAWGRDRGVDIDATKENQRWFIEVKGQGSRNAMRVNYFLGILGETLQRMEDSNAKYSIALPDMQQFRNLWMRLPLLAKSRTGITAIFVTRDGKVSEIP